MTFSSGVEGVFLRYSTMAFKISNCGRSCLRLSRAIFGYSLKIVPELSPAIVEIDLRFYESIQDAFVLEPYRIG